MEKKYNNKSQFTHTTNQKTNSKNNKINPINVILGILIKYYTAMLYYFYQVKIDSLIFLICQL